MLTACVPPPGLAGGNPLPILTNSRRAKSTESGRSGRSVMFVTRPTHTVLSSLMSDSSASKIHSDEVRRTQVRVTFWQM